jgi:hypothetical protein
MFGIDWTNLQVYHYIAIGGGALTVLALVLYFLLPSGFKVPAGVLGTIAGLVAGLGIGVIGMAGFGYHFDPSSEGGGPSGPPTGQGDGKAFGMPKGMPGGGMPGGGMPGGGMPGGGAPGFGGGKGKGKGPSPKAQLATLVTKIDQLVEEPLSLNLSSAQRSVIREQIKGLETAEGVDDDEAKTRLEAILEAVKDDRATLEAAGYRWPGATGLQMPGVASNPFQEPENRKHLAALQANLAKK